MTDPDQSSSDQALVEVLGIATALSSASDLCTLPHLILSKCRQLPNSDAGSMFLVERSDPRKQPEGEKQLWFAVSQNVTIDARMAGDDSVAAMEAQVLDIHFPLSPERLLGWCALSGEVLNIPDDYQLYPALLYRFDRAMVCLLDYRAVSMLTLPIRPPSGEVVGVVQLINRKHDAATLTTPETVHALTWPYDRFGQTLIEALASQAAEVFVERTCLLESLGAADCRHHRPAGRRD